MNNEKMERVKREQLISSSNQQEGSNLDFSGKTALFIYVSFHCHKMIVEVAHNQGHFSAT